jgi:CheY-like chemotaxis protein
LEDILRVKLETAMSASVTSAYRAMLAEQQGDGTALSTDATDALLRAGQAQSDALVEYTYVLRTFTDLTIHGKMPEDESAAGSYGGRAVREVSLILIVDDDESIREATKTLLRSAGYQVQTFASAERVLESGALEETECLILDVRMPGMDGLELQRRLNAEGVDVPVIFITAHDDAAVRRRAIEGGAINLLYKPFAAAELLETVQASARGRNMSH